MCDLYQESESCWLYPLPDRAQGSLPLHFWSPEAGEPGGAWVDREPWVAPARQSAGELVVLGAPLLPQRVGLHPHLLRLPLLSELPAFPQCNPGKSCWVEEHFDLVSLADLSWVLCRSALGRGGEVANSAPPPGAVWVGSEIVVVGMGPRRRLRPLPLWPVQGFVALVASVSGYHRNAGPLNSVVEWGGDTVGWIAAEAAVPPFLPLSTLSASHPSHPWM